MFLGNRIKLVRVFPPEPQAWISVLVYQNWLILLRVVLVIASYPTLREVVKTYLTCLSRTHFWGGRLGERPWVSQAWWVDGEEAMALQTWREKWNGSWAIKLTILQYLCTRATRSNNCATLVQHYFILFMCNSSSLEILDMQFTPKINFLLPWYFNNVSCTIFSYFHRT